MSCKSRPVSAGPEWFARPSTGRDRDASAFERKTGLELVLDRGMVTWEGGTGSSKAFLASAQANHPSPCRARPSPVLLIDKFGRAIHGERCATPWLLM